MDDSGYVLARSISSDLAASAITDNLGDRFVDFWCENARCFAESEPLLGLADEEAGY